jgi:ATP adenylyltransferase
VNVDDLIDFIERKMRMSHVYQPLLVRTLAEAGGAATLRQLALAFLAADEAQIRWYEDRIKKMPLPVLRRHGVVERDGDLVRLNAPKLTLEDRARVKAACETKIQEFVARRGLGAWDYRLIEVDPVPESIRYRVLARSKGRCDLCHSNERPLQVDHITPRSKGGTNEETNLQVLCDLCNRGKSNRDDADFRIVEDLPLH